MSARAKFPVIHIPSAPTPGPPSSSCTWRHSLRSQSVMGLEPPVANTWNSCEMQQCSIEETTYPPLTGLSTTPNISGRNTVNPRSRTIRANLATRGVIPGTSCMMTTPGPLPLRQTGFVTPSMVTSVRSKSSARGLRAGNMAVHEPKGPGLAKEARATSANAPA